MTVLTVARDKTSITIAADGQMTARGQVISVSYKKIWRVSQGGSDWLFAGTGSVRNIQVARHQFKPPHGDETKMMRYMVGTFIPALRDSLKSAGQERVSGEVARPNDIALIAARGSHIFAVGSDYSVVEITEPFWADGSGYGYAMGSMFSVGGKKAELVARAGVEAAVRFDAFCSGEIQVETIAVKVQ